MPTTHLQTDGDISQAKRKRAGEVPSIGELAQSVYDPNPAIRNAQARNDAAQQRNAENGLPAPTGPNPARAARMQAQFNQPVTVGVPVAAGQSAGADLSGAASRLKNAYSVVSPLLNPVGTTVDVLTATPADALRNATIRAAGGDPATSEGGETANRDRAFQRIKPAVDAIRGAGESLREGISGGILSATGASPAQPSMPAPTKPAPGQGQAAPQETRPAAAKPADSPYFATDSGIAVRRNENGVTEFSNDPQALANAQAMPAGGIGGQTLRTPGVSNMADDVALERRGSINNIGNGIGGGLSVGAPGDAALALGRFERANQEREKMIQASRRGEIGEGGGRLTIVADSTRTPTRRERQLARLDARLAETESLRAGIREAAATGADTRATNSLTRTKTQQDIATGELALQSAQAVQQLRALMADPSLTDAERQAAIQAYSALTISPKDRYMTVEGGTNEFGGRDASRVFDRLTGQGIGSPSAALPRSSVPYSEIEATAKATGMSAKKIEAELVAKGVKIER